MRSSNEITQTDGLFSRYVDVLNRIIGDNRDGIYGVLAKLWAMTLADELVAVGIYSTNANNPFRWYTIQLSGGRLAVIQPCRSPDARMTWRINLVHLVRVVENPDAYVERPARLDLDWLKTRVGLC